MLGAVMSITERLALFEGIFGCVVFFWIQLVLGDALESLAGPVGVQLRHVGDKFLSHMSYRSHQCFNRLKSEIMGVKAAWLLPVDVRILIDT